MHKKMKANSLKTEKLSRKKKTPKRRENLNVSNGDTINISSDKTNTSPQTQDCIMDISTEVTNKTLDSGELEALGVLTVPSQHQKALSGKQLKINLQPLEFRAIGPKTEPDCLPLNPPNTEIKSEPGVYEAFQRESGLSVKEENEDNWKEIKQEPSDENSLDDFEQEINTGKLFLLCSLVICDVTFI